MVRWWGRRVPTFLGSMEADVKLLHAIVDERDLVVRHEAVRGMIVQCKRTHGVSQSARDNQAALEIAALSLQFHDVGLDTSLRRSHCDLCQSNRSY